MTLRHTCQQGICHIKCPMCNSGYRQVFKNDGSNNMLPLFSLYMCFLTSFENLAGWRYFLVHGNIVTLTYWNVMHKNIGGLTTL